MGTLLSTSTPNKMHHNTIFACAIAFGCLNLANTILVETGASALGLGFASLSSIALPTLTLTGTAASAASLGAVAGVAGLAASKKRAAVDTCMPFQNPDLFLALAAGSDKLGCAQKLVCILEKTADEKLNESEKLILNLFGRAPA